MSLVWLLRRRADEEHAERAAQLEAALDDPTLPDDKCDALLAQLEEISEAPEETLRAPRVGIDEKATEFFHELWEEQHERALTAGARSDDEEDEPEEGEPDWAKPWEEILEEARGAPVIQLTDYVPPAEVGFWEDDPLSFNGMDLFECEDLTEKLRDEAREDHTAKEALAFANRLEKLILRVLGEKQFGPVAKKYERLSARSGEFEDEGEAEEWEDALPKAEREILYLSAPFEAARWLRFWGERGHGFRAWH